MPQRVPLPESGDHQQLLNLQGGTLVERYHLDQSEHDALITSIAGPTWNTAGRPTPAAGEHPRGFNTDLVRWEYWDGTDWKALPGYKDGVAWEDLRMVPGAFDFAGASDPVLSNWQPGGAGATFKVFEFNNGNEVFFTCQMPHAYKEGTDLKPHVHWSPRARGVAENGNTVAWKLDVAIANVEGVFLSSITVDLTDVCAGVNERHEISPSGTINGTGLTISHVLVCRLYRDVGDSWSLNTLGNRPVLLEFDIHFEKDTPGSRQELVK